MFAVVKKCMKKVTQSDAGEGKNYEEYENFESDYETSNHKERNSRRDYNDRPNTYGNNFNPRINQHYEPQQTGGNFNANDRRDPYQHADNNNFNNRNNFYGNSNNHNDSHRSNSSSNHERDRACILQCFFEELKMVKKFLSLHLLFRFYEMSSACRMVKSWTYVLMLSPDDFCASAFQTFVKHFSRIFLPSLVIVFFVQNEISKIIFQCSAPDE